jgi:hypothetical protein
MDQGILCLYGLTLYNFIMSIKIITYPRSGAHYLQRLMFSATGKLIEFSHKKDISGSTVITIARDPFESIHSHVVMKKHYDINDGYTKLDNIQYISTYDFLYEDAQIVIDYNNLVKSPENITEKVLNMLGLKKSLANSLTLNDDKDSLHLVSSKSSPEYKNKQFSLSDIADCYEPYNRLLSKAVT